MEESLARGIEQRQLAAASLAIKQVAEQFRQTPGSFLYESDLQGLLYAELFDALAREPIRWKPGDARWDDVTDGEPLTINPARTEYPSDRRFDVAVLSPRLNHEQNAWGQPVRIGIELKFRQVDGTGGGFQRDMDKLREYEREQRAAHRDFTGVCLVFSHRARDEFLAEWTRDPPEGGRIITNPAELSLPTCDVVAWAITPTKTRT